MNRALRRRHVVLWLVIGPVVVALLVAGVVVKRGSAAAPETAGAGP